LLMISVIQKLLEKENVINAFSLISRDDKFTLEK